jgi:HEPN domain-containing protein
MSEKNLRQEAERWYAQSKDDLEASSALSAAKKYAQTCFYTQQAAEKALRAVCYLLDIDFREHFCARLIQSLPEAEQIAFADVMERP